MKVLSFDKFLELFREEENYYDGEQHNTKLMFTRLRKIYYDSWGWSAQVIRKAAKTPGRYYTKIVSVENLSNNIEKGYKQDNAHKIISHAYRVVYTKNDKIYPERAGQTPEIHSDDNREIVTPQGICCDIGHILAGIDAYNNFSPISPLPGWLFFFRRLLPSINSNMDFATWLGDIASVSGDFLLYALDRKCISKNEEQKIIDKNIPASDTIGNIDSYVIKEIFNTESSNGLKVSEILENYFESSEFVDNYQSKKVSIFSAGIGLKGWDGEKFLNEKEWIWHSKSQLRNATAFYVFGKIGKLKGFWLALKIWLRQYEAIMKLEALLKIFIDSLKKQILLEQKRP